MAKILLLVVVAAAVYFILRGYARAVARKDNVNAGKDVARAEDMVQCRHCGVHLPRSEALIVQGDHYCSEEHLRSTEQP